MSNSSVKKLSYNVPFGISLICRLKKHLYIPILEQEKLYENDGKARLPVFVLWIGSRRMIKEKSPFEEYIANQYLYLMKKSNLR